MGNNVKFLEFFFFFFFLNPNDLDLLGTTNAFIGNPGRRGIFFYRMPDYKSVLNCFIWQEYDLAPDHPRLFEFIEFWGKEIEGPLHSVRFTHRKLIGPGEWRNEVGEFTLH